MTVSSSPNSNYAGCVVPDIPRRVQRPRSEFVCDCLNKHESVIGEQRRKQSQVRVAAIKGFGLILGIGGDKDWPIYGSQDIKKVCFTSFLLYRPYI